ncbi:class I SAM-dependent methyltransferase [Leeia oryzae]|uniref:class I SAM-dependent methyltransferase n=1 Tax=Leeia oryzae TaxID=356662 RepID=UPI00035E466A|nr:class I SAM-dependent methyltransferase [Leeia oryzae]
MTSKLRFVRLTFSFLLVVLSGWMATSLVLSLGQFGSPWLRLAFAIACYSGVVWWLSAICLHNRVWRSAALLFYPVTLLAVAANVPVWLPLVALLLLILAGGQAWRGRVPLFLSHAAVLDALNQILPETPRLVFAELGSGTGTVLAHICSRRPDWQLHGYELAWLPYSYSWWRFRRQKRVTLHRQDFMATDWSGFDVVYAFLSPLVMEDVWQKAMQEMKPGSLLISNSFDVAEHPADIMLDTGKHRQARVLVWKMKAKEEA